MFTPRAPSFWPLILLAAQTLGCGFLLPDRIHWTVEPDAISTCDVPAPDEPLREIVGVALSGGGSRAAVYGAAGLEALWEHGLLDQISHMSSVSGGSIAASYLVTNRPACDQEATQAAANTCWREFFSEFKTAMRYNYAWASERRQLLFPNRWLSHTRRATSFQEVLDREFLNKQTFGELHASRSNGPREGGPRPLTLIINAASYDEARRFVFSNMCLGKLTGASRSASFSRPGCAAPVPRDLPLSLAVAASASFPGLFGPVALEVPPSCDVAHPEWWHLGDGGMIDNLGVDTLEEVVQEAVEADSRSVSTVALISFDASRELRTTLLKGLPNYTLLRRDPSRIVTLTKARGNAYHDLAWEQKKRDLADRGVRADRIALRYMEAELESWPSSCWVEASRSAGSTASQVDRIRDRLEEIPTLLSINNCGADLLERAAHQVVHESLNGEAGQRLRELGIRVRTASRHECTVDRVEPHVDEESDPDDA